MTILRFLRSIFTRPRPCKPDETAAQCAERLTDKQKGMRA